MRYAGSELGLFQNAVNWKSYFAAHLRPHIVGDVLEVGAGIGATTLVLHTPETRTWTCLEPDSTLAHSINERIRAGESPDCRLCVGTIDSINPQARFDTILYVDVLEHIERDGDEFVAAAARLRGSGKLIILVPAHQFLFTNFDRNIGHHRRYDRARLSELHAPGLQAIQIRYLDSVGMLASLGNRLLLQSGMPSLGQIRFWDRFLVPLSCHVDRLFGHRLGKSIYGVWQQED